jgi:hypothetical protein
LRSDSPTPWRAIRPAITRPPASRGRRRSTAFATSPAASIATARRRSGPSPRRSAAAVTRAQTPTNS